jgi:hypothetical protein
MGLDEPLPVTVELPDDHVTRRRNIRSAHPDLPDDQITPFSGRAFPLPGDFTFGFVTMHPDGSTQLPAELDLATALE